MDRRLSRSVSVCDHFFIHMSLQSLRFLASSSGGDNILGYKFGDSPTSGLALTPTSVDLVKNGSPRIQMGSTSVSFADSFSGSSLSCSSLSASSISSSGPMTTGDVEISNSYTFGSTITTPSVSGVAFTCGSVDFTNTSNTTMVTTFSTDQLITGNIFSGPDMFQLTCPTAVSIPNGLSFAPFSTVSISNPQFTYASNVITYSGSPAIYQVTLHCEFQNSANGFFQSFFQTADNLSDWSARRWCQTAAPKKTAPFSQHATENIEIIVGVSNYMRIFLYSATTGNFWGGTPTAITFTKLA
jgi:hypothetical protein